MTRPRPIRDFALAVTLLTCVPLRVSTPQDHEPSDAASWFPLVGLLMGLATAGVLLAVLRFFYIVTPTMAATILILLALVTRLLHWDGLADVADAFFVDSSRRLEVLSDTHIGAFGASAVALVALWEWSALSDVATTRAGVGIVLLALVFSRTAATFAAWFGRAARTAGLGASVMHRPSVIGVTVSSIAVAFGVTSAYAVGLTGWAALGVFGIGLVLALAVPHLLSLRFGGVTGDVMGASVQLVETGVLVLGLALLSILRLLGVSA